MAKLPEGWIVADLGEFCEGIRGVTYKPDDLVQVKTEKTITLLRSNNIQAGALNFKDVQHVAQKNVNQKQVAQLGDIAVCHLLHELGVLHRGLGCLTGVELIEDRH